MMMIWVVLMRAPKNSYVLDVNVVEVKPNGLLRVWYCAIASGIVATPMAAIRICSSAVRKSLARRRIGSNTSTSVATDISAPTVTPIATSPSSDSSTRWSTR